MSVSLRFGGSGVEGHGLRCLACKVCVLGLRVSGSAMQGCRIYSLKP